MTEYIGTEWDYVMDSLLAQIEDSNMRKFVYEDEFSTMESIIEHSSDSLNVDLRNWLMLREEKAKIRTVEASEKFRSAGNKAFQQRQFDVAAAYYTEAIAAAPKDSISLALAHANRASTCTRPNTFVETGYYDCVLALKFNYPLNKRNKLLDRKFHLALMLHNKQFIGDTIGEMEELVQTNAFTREQLKLSLRKKQYEEIDESNVPQSVLFDYLDPAATPHNFAYAKLTEKYEASVGRYVIADQTILKNQPIFREKAFAFVPVHDYADEIERPFSCENCAKTNCLPFPCIECCRALYCSLKCKEQHEYIHEHECAGYKMNLWRTIGIAHLAFRAFIVGIQDSFNILKNVAPMDAIEIVNALAVVKDESFTYASVLNLMTNFNEMNVRDCLSYALTAYMLKIYLDEYTTLRGKFIDLVKSPADWDILSRVLIMKHIGQLVSNGHAITDFELRSPIQTNEGYRPECDNISARHLYRVVSSSRIFTALFPRISILNHSCDPNIRNTFNGPFLCIYASCDIMAGDEVLNCYGPNYKLMSRSERQIALKQQYCFECQCDKCITDDKTRMKYYEYICTKKDCENRRIVDVDDQNWWHHLDNHSHIHNMFYKFYCNECDTYLITPQLLTLCQMIENQEVLDPAAMIACWVNGSRALSKNHELRAVLAQGILRRSNMHVFTRENINKFAVLAVDNLTLMRDRYGLFSMEYVMATTYALFILERIQFFAKQSNDADFHSKLDCIRTIFDVKCIEKSYTILSPLTKSIFCNALREVGHGKVVKTSHLNVQPLLY